MQRRSKESKLGKKSYGGTPGHIPNPEVKSVNAESTQGAAPWEDRNLPSLCYFWKKYGDQTILYIQIEVIKLF